MSKHSRFWQDWTTSPLQYTSQPHRQGCTSCINILVLTFYIFVISTRIIATSLAYVSLNFIGLQNNFWARTLYKYFIYIYIYMKTTERERRRETVEYPFRSTSTFTLEELNPQLREKCQNKRKLESSGTLVWNIRKFEIVIWRNWMQMLK